MADAAEERLVVALEARIRDFEKNMAKAKKSANDNLAGIEKRAQQSVPRLQKAMENAGKGLSAGLAAGLGAIGTGGAGIAGVLAGVKQAVSSVADMAAEAKRAGLGVEAFQELSYAAQQARVNLDGLSDGVKEMQLRADEFITTGAGGGAEAFQRLGFTADELKTKLHDPAALFGDVIERLRELDKAAQIRVTDEIFGGTGGEQFVRFLEMGRNSIERLRQDARETGNVLDDEMVKRAEEIDRKFEALATTVGTKLKGAVLEVVAAIAKIQLPSVEDLSKGAPLDGIVPGYTPRATTFDVGGDPQMPSSGVPLPPTRPQGLAGAGDTSHIKRTGETLKRGYADLQAAAQARVKDLLAEQSALGMTTEAAETYRLKQQAIAEAQRMQITLTPQQVAELDELASQYGAVAAAMEQAYAEQSRSMQLQQELGSIAASTLSGLADGTQSWGEALQSVTRRLTDLVLQAALLGDGPLGGMFGNAASGGKAGGIIGGLFKAFGFAEGGVMTPHGPRHLKRYAGGGISRTAAIFGEAGAEAAVPLPDGRRIPVELKTNMPPASRGGSSGADIRLSVTQNIDARGSEMSEERMATLLQHSNAQLLAQVKRWPAIDARGVPPARSPLIARRCFTGSM